MLFSYIDMEYTKCEHTLFLVITLLGFCRYISYAVSTFVVSSGLKEYSYSERLFISNLESLELRRLYFDLKMCFLITHKLIDLFLFIHSSHSIVNNILQKLQI